MSEAKGEHEPSMEEILASIRRIIAEDGDAAASAQGAAPPLPPLSGGPRQDEVLELTEVVEEDGSVVSIGAKSAAPEPPPAPKPPQPAVFEPDEQELPPPLPRETLDLDENERLISAEAATASVAALSQLAASRSSGRGEDLLVSAGGRTLEELVCEMLRPLLKTWLDDNLPQLVERLVQDEINRLVREAQGR